MNTAKRIYYVSAPCGAGKTTAAVGYIKENTHNRNFVVVVPTVLMVEQWSKALNENGIVAEAITSSSCGMNVKKIIIDRQNKFKPQGHVQIITWNAYSELPFRPPHKNIQVIIDELPQTDEFFPWDIGHHIDELANVIAIDRPINDKVSVVCASDVNELERYEDDVDALFDKFKRHLQSSSRTVFVDAEAYERVFYRRNISQNGRDANRVSFLSMLNPRLLEGTILLGANIEASILFKWMTRIHDVKFIKHADILGRLQPQFPSGHLLKLYYFFEGDVRASKYRFNCAASDGRKIIDEMDRLAIETFGGKPFLFVKNNDQKAELLRECAGALRMPVESRGLNSYRDYDNIYFAAALNREPKHVSMLEDLGLSSDEVYRATTCEQAHQALFRSSLRDRSAQRLVTAIVPDLITATYISDLVGSVSIERLDIAHEWKAKPLTSCQKKQRMRAKKALKKVFASKWVPPSLPKENGGQSVEGNSWVTPPEPRGELATLVGSGNNLITECEFEGGNQFTCYVTFHERLQACEEDEHVVVSKTPMEFVSLLKTQWRSFQDNKCARALFNAATFKRREGTSGWRTLENFQSSSMMVLDFDGGSLSPEDFWAFFGPDAGPGRRLNFALYNSFSRTPEQPNKFHAVIFYRRHARSINEHRAVFDGIVRRLEQVGFHAKESGLDRASSTGVQSFYLPATNRAFPDMAFFRTHGVTTRELATAIDPSSYAKTRIVSEPARAPQHKSCQRSVGDIKEILDPLRNLKSSRHVALFQAAVALEDLGLSPNEIDGQLVGVFGSEPKMLKKIRDANKSLARYRFTAGQVSAYANSAPS